jgi:hypothetical protein
MSITLSHHKSKIKTMSNVHISKLNAVSTTYAMMLTSLLHRIGVELIFYKKIIEKDEYLEPFFASYIVILMKIIYAKTYF